MLSLLFNRFPKRRVVGLLALGEWGPPTGAPAAVSGTIATEQPDQQDLASGAVVQAVVTVVGGGGGGSLGGPAAGKIPAVTGVGRTEQPAQQSRLNAKLEISGNAVSCQRRQETVASGETKFTINGVCETQQPIQRPRLVGNLEILGDAVSAQSRQQGIADSVLEIRGVCGTEQERQQSALAGSAVHPQPAGSVEVVGMCATGQRAQHSDASATLGCNGKAATLQAIQADVLSGDMIDVELELIAAILLAA